ncbi:MAG: hypothetical protein AAGF11_51595 [Myxococcota bacterium]
MNIDIPRLEADIRALEQRIRTLKQPLRRTWTQPMADTQAQWLGLAAQITALYTLRAWLRDRLHRTQPPRDLRDSCRALGVPLEWDARRHNRKVAERVAPCYRLPDQPPGQPPENGRALRC